MTHALLDCLWSALGESDDDTGAIGSHAVPQRDRVAARADVLPIADHALLERIRGGDELAFRDMYLEHVQPLWRFARRFVNAPDAATDVVQDVFASIWLRRDAWHPAGAIRTYLFGAVRHRALAVLRDLGVASRAVARAQYDIVPPGMGHPTGDVAERMVQDELAAAVARAIDTLPERQRSAVLLRWNDDMNAAEIARVLGVSDTAVRKLLLAARRRIEAELPQRD